MKAYVAPKSVVLSMNINENIAASARVTFNGSYYLNGDKVENSEFVYTGSSYVQDLVDWITSLTTTQAAQKAELENCLVNPRA